MMLNKFPENLEDVIVLAETFLERLEKSQSSNDLFAAVLACNQLPDWYYRCHHGQEFKYKQGCPFSTQFPEWEMIRQIANGLKHCKPNRPNQRLGQLEWENDDFWLGYHGDEEPVWFVEDNDGKERMVSVICSSFLRAFKVWL